MLETLKFAKLLRTPVLKNICKRLLLEIAKFPNSYIFE